MNQRYRLHFHPLSDPKPMMIVDHIDGRLIANVRDGCRATMAEAQIMTDALNASIDSFHPPGYRNASEDEPERDAGRKP